MSLRRQHAIFVEKWRNTEHGYPLTIADVRATGAANETVCFLPFGWKLKSTSCLLFIFTYVFVIFRGLVDYATL